jgi:hypothetical protein
MHNTRLLKPHWIIIVLLSFPSINICNAQQSAEYYRLFSSFFGIGRNTINEAISYYRTAYNENPNTACFVVKYAHCLFLKDYFSMQERSGERLKVTENDNDPNNDKLCASLYEKALRLIKDEKEFNDNVVYDFELFIRNGWEKEKCIEKLEELKKTFRAIHTPWNITKPTQFQNCLVADLDSLKDKFEELDRSNICSVFHFLTKYKLFNYNEASSESGQLDYFTLNHLQSDHKEFLNKKGTLGNTIPNKLVINKYIKLDSRTYDFTIHSFHLNVSSVLDENLHQDIQHYKPDVPLSDLYHISSFLECKLSNVPTSLELNIGNDSVAEDWSKNNIVLHLYVEILSQPAPRPKQNDFPCAFFREILGKKGYKSFSGISKQQLRKEENDYYTRYRSQPYTRYIIYPLILNVKWITLELPNNDVVMWMPQ